MRYDAGLLSDFGGGDVGWWQDYLRSELDRAHEFYDDRIAELERERDEARAILAHTDIGSLPDDWTLRMVAEARIDDLIKLRDQVRDTCARAERAEAEVARLREAALEAAETLSIESEYCFSHAKTCERNNEFDRAERHKDRGYRLRIAGEKLRAALAREE